MLRVTGSSSTLISYKLLIMILSKTGVLNEQTLLGIVVGLIVTLIIFGCVVVFILLRKKSSRVKDNNDAMGPSEDNTVESRKQSRISTRNLEDDQPTKMVWRSSNLYRPIKRLYKGPADGSDPELVIPTSKVAMSPKENAPAEQEFRTLESKHTSPEDTCDKAERSE